MPSPSSPLRILLTNDDGFDAPGLATLAEVAHEFTRDIWIVAPQHDESGTGQSLSLHHPLRCHARGERRWAVSGTPADCVALALAHMMRDSKPTLILSGVNAGTNTGDDVNLSGTLGAAFMGLMLGVPSIAISQDFATRKSVRWDTTRAIVPKLLKHFLEVGWRKETCLSVNIPDLPAHEITGFTWARQSPRTTASVHYEKREDMREQDYFWLSLHDREDEAGRGDNSDIAVLNRGEVAVTALSLDRSVDVASPSVIFDDATATGTHD